MSLWYRIQLLWKAQSQAAVDPEADFRRVLTGLEEKTNEVRVLRAKLQGRFDVAAAAYAGLVAREKALAHAVAASRGERERKQLEQATREREDAAAEGWRLRAQLEALDVEAAETRRLLNILRDEAAAATAKLAAAEAARAILHAAAGIGDDGLALARLKEAAQRMEAEREAALELSPYEYRRPPGRSK